MVEKLIHCVECNVVMPDPDGHKDSSLLPGVEWSSHDRMRQNRFFHSHKDHRKEVLRVIPETYLSESQSAGGLGTSYFNTTNGTRRYLIRRIKRSFEEGALYEIVPGRLRVRNETLSIQEEDLRRQISSDAADLLSPEKVDKFIEAFRERVKTIPLQNAREELEIAEGENSLTVYGTMKKPAWENVLARCRPDFQNQEIAAIRKFIVENSEPVDVLVNDRLIARGEVVVIDDRFGVRITDVPSPAQRLNSLKER